MTVTRFPPSPTGYLHIGGVRTALYSWLHARHNNGEFVLRIEDTDLERSTPESVQAILDGMRWLGLAHDRGPFYQTQRFDRYAGIIEQLLSRQQAYYCECSKQRLEEMREQQKAAGLKPKYDGRCRELGLPAGENRVVRFKNPQQGEVSFVDRVKGHIAIANTELDDLVIARADGVPTYNLTVVVDDMDMGVTDVIRGDDHINNTPRQINLLAALNADIPSYAHVPMILGEDGARLSKRHGAVSVMQYRDDGYLPEALLSYLLRLGWSHGDQELFTIQEMLDLFRIENVNRSPSTFNPQKLLWVNQEFIKALSPEELLQKSAWHFEQAKLDIEDPDYAQRVMALIRERCKTLLDVVTQSRYFFSEIFDYDVAQMKKHIKSASLGPLEHLIELLVQLDDWQASSIHACLQNTADRFELGFAKLAQPVRIAVTGSTNSPSIDQTLTLLGSDKTIDRLRAAIPKFEAYLAHN